MGRHGLRPRYDKGWVGPAAIGNGSEQNHGVEIDARVQVGESFKT